MGTGAQAPRFEGSVISSPYLAKQKNNQNNQNLKTNEIKKNINTIQNPERSTRLL
jgi:hypothetical protein